MFNPGSEQSIAVGTKTYRLGRLTVGVLREFQQWAAERVGDPFEVADRYLDRVPPEEATRLIREASELRDQLKFFSLACPLAQKLMATEEGASKMLHLLLLQKDAKATEDDALALALHLGGQAQEVLARAQGGGGGSADPNAAGAAAGPESAGATSTGG